MTWPSPISKFFCALCAWLTLAALPAMSLGEETADTSAKDNAKKPAETKPVPKELFTGQVVLLSEAFKRRGIAAYDEMKNQAALETPEGELIPLVADWRGRAFFQDKRLRNRKVELVGMRRPGVPYLQVLVVYTFNKQGERTYVDYWCDICSIPMYEIKPCDCCQADIRLRFQPQDLPAEFLKNVAPKAPAEPSQP